MSTFEELVEARARASSQLFEVRKNLGMADFTQFETPDTLATPEQQATTERGYKLLKSKYNQAIRSIIIDLVSDELSKARAKTAFKQEAREYFRKAYVYGVRYYTGDRTPDLDQSTLQFVTQAADEETGHFDEVLKSVVKIARKGDPYGTDVDKWSSRVDAYVRALDSMYEAGKLAATPTLTLFHWIYGDAEHCESCIYLRDHSPYTKDTLPTTPRAGATKCFCILDPTTEILTSRGNVPIASVVPGDYVYTHRNRWKKVLATPTTLSTTEVGTIVCAENSVLFCTQDHKLWDGEGWVNAKDSKYCVRMRGSQGSPVEKVSVVCQQVTDKNTVGKHRGQDAKSPPGGGVRPEEVVPGSEGRGLSSQEARRESLREVLVPADKEVQVCLPISLAVGKGKRGNSTRLRTSPCERGPHRQPNGEFAASSFEQFSHENPHDSGTGEENQETVPGNRSLPEDVVGMPDLRGGVLELLEGRKVPSQVLFERVCIPPSTVMFDLTVEEDASFVANGIVVHNSNCKCSIETEAVSEQEYRRVVSSSLTKEALLMQLERIKTLHTGSRRR